MKEIHCQKTEYTAKLTLKNETLIMTFQNTTEKHKKYSTECFRPKKKEHQIVIQIHTHKKLCVYLWKSDNQGVQEETFIQTGRKGKHGQPGWRGPMARWHLEDPDRRGGGLQTRHPPVCMQINLEEQLGSRTDCSIQGSSLGK